MRQAPPEAAKSSILIKVWMAPRLLFANIQLLALLFHLAQLHGASISRRFGGCVQNPLGNVGIGEIW